MPRFMSLRDGLLVVRRVEGSSWIVTAYRVQEDLPKIAEL